MCIDFVQYYNLVLQLMRNLLIYFFCCLGFFTPQYAHTQQVVDTSVYKKPVMNISSKIATPYPYSIKKNTSTEKTIWFYIFSTLTLAFALLQLGFPKYFKDLYRLAFQSSFKQRQLRERLLQNPQSSLLLNIFFILNVSVYAAVLLQYFGFSLSSDIWIDIIICAIFFTIIYTGKYIILYAIGWLFNAKEAATTYTFVVFSIHKIIGLLLLPISILFVFADVYLHNTIIAGSMGIVGLLFIYRYIASYNIVRSNIAVSRFHFFIYLCAFEILPLWLVLKALSYFIKSIR